jgi:hypothetical protein
MLSMPGLGGAAAAAAAPAASWPSQVTRPHAASCPRGETLIAPTSGWTDALGVAHLTYEAAPGIVASIPPRGLTARQVTPAIMADMGMKVRKPTSSSEQRMAKLVINLGRNRTAPEFCRSKARDVPNIHEDILNTHVYESNWGGYAVTKSEFGANINGATGSWTVPRSMTSMEPSSELTWVGVGGDIGGETQGWGLIQAGTSMTYKKGYRTFWEYIGSSGCVNTICGQFSSTDAVAPGESVAADVWWDSSTSATFVLYTSGGNGQWDITNYSVDVPYDHTSAEWVNENQLIDNFIYDSPGTVQFAGQALSSGFAGQGSFISPFSGSYEAVIMTIGSAIGTNCINGNGTVLSYPENASNSSNGGSSDIVTCQIAGTDYP